MTELLATGQPHPEFKVLNDLRPDDGGITRRCTRCGRVESRVYTGEWTRKPHLEHVVAFPEEEA